MQFKIGVMLESFRLPTNEALAKAAALGAQGIQMYATTGEHAPENMSGAARRELLSRVKDAGLVFSALCGDLGHGFGDAEQNPALIEKSKRILDMAKELETDIVTTHIGVVPSDPKHPRYAVMQDACGRLAEYADSIGAHFAVETGPETASTLCGFLDSLHSTGVAVNYDPANLAMVTADDPVKGVEILKKYIVHTHAKDGVHLLQGNPEYIYQVVHPVPESVKGIKYFREVPLGQGDVDFPRYLAALDKIGYKGFLTVERECGDTPEKDIGDAVNFLRKLF